MVDWGSVPDWIVAGTAVFGVGAGMYQLSAIRRSNIQTTQFERAKLLLEFDRDLESDAMTDSRQKLLAVRNRFESEIVGEARKLTTDEQIEDVAKRISTYVTDVWQRSREYDGDPDADKDSSASEYKLIMRISSWCETIGHQTRRNLVPLDDVLDLYDQLVINTIGNLRHHIRWRSEQGPHKNARYLENALWLFEKASDYKRRRSQPIPVHPTQSQVDWTG